MEIVIDSQYFCMYGWSLRATIFRIFSFFNIQWEIACPLVHFAKSSRPIVGADYTVRQTRLETFATWRSCRPTKPRVTCFQFIFHWVDFSLCPFRPINQKINKDREITACENPSCIRNRTIINLKYKVSEWWLKLWNKKNIEKIKY